MQRLSRTTNRQGFSLLEVLVVIGLISVVTALGISSFVAVTGAWSERRALERLDVIVVDAFDSLERDLGDMLSAEVSGLSLAGTSEDYRVTGSVPPTYLPSDSTIFAVQGARSGGNLQHSKRVKYAIERGGSGNYLARFETPIGNDNFNNGVHVTPEGVKMTGLRIEYAESDSGAWLSEWNRADLPEAVRVSISVQDAYKPHIQVARKRVFPVHVR